MQIFKLQRRSLLTTPQQSAPESLLAGETEAKEPNQSRSVGTSDVMVYSSGFACESNNLTVTSTIDSFLLFIYFVEGHRIISLYKMLVKLKET